MKLLACFLSIISAVLCGELIYVNKILDNQLLTIGNYLRKEHIKYIKIGDVEIGDDISATNVRLGDITKIIRKGDATLTTDENTIIEQAAVGINKLDLLMDKLELNGKTYNKVLVVIYSNKLSFKTNIHTTRTECNQTYSGIQVSQVEGVMLYSRPTTKMNITSQFLKEVVPYVNKKLSSPYFIKLINKYLNSCGTNQTGLPFDIFQTSDSFESIPLYDDYRTVLKDNQPDIDETSIEEFTAILGKILKNMDYPQVQFAIQ